MDDFEHELVDPLDHIPAVALQSCLHAGVVEHLPHDQTGFVGRVLPVLVEFHHQLVLLVELESDVPQFSPWLSRLRLLLHQVAHEGHLPHAGCDGGDDQCGAEHVFGGNHHLGHVGLQLVLDPQGEGSEVVGGDGFPLILLFLLARLLVLLLHALQHPLHVGSGIFDVGEFESLIGLHLVEDEFLDGGVGE